MKILFCNRYNCFNKPGKDTIQMLKTKNFLKYLPGIMLTENFDIRNIGQIRKLKVVTI